MLSKVLPGLSEVSSLTCLGGKTTKCLSQTCQPHGLATMKEITTQVQLLRLVVQPPLQHLQVGATRGAVYEMQGNHLLQVQAERLTKTPRPTMDGEVGFKRKGME